MQALHSCRKDVLVASARADGADLLVVDVVCAGSRGRSRAAAAVLGSTAQSVIARATRPVLVVRTPDR